MTLCYFDLDITVNVGDSRPTWLLTSSLPARPTGGGGCRVNKSL